MFWAATYRKALPVQTARVQMSGIRSSISTNGKVEADKIYEIHAPFSGIVRDIRVRLGQELVANQPLLSVVDPSLDSELEAARAELAAAQADLQTVRRGPPKVEIDQADAEIARQKLEVETAQKNLQTNEWLLKRGAIPRYEVDQSRSKLDMAQQALSAAETHRNDLAARYTSADLQRAETRLEAAAAKLRLLQGNKSRSEVRAPADGTLYHLEARDGTHVNGGDLMGLFANLKHLRVRAFVDEPDLGQVSEGADAVVHWDARPQESWKGKVRFIPSEVVTRGTRSVAEVLCSIDSPPNDLIPNVNVDVDILSAEGQPVPTIPRTALIVEGDNRFVWVIRNSEAVRQPVTIGRNTPSEVEIKRGLSVDDEFVIPGEAPISEGTKVRVVGR